MLDLTSELEKTCLCPNPGHFMADVHLRASQEERLDFVKRQKFTIPMIAMPSPIRATHQGSKIHGGLTEGIDPDMLMVETTAGAPIPMIRLITRIQLAPLDAVSILCSAAVSTGLFCLFLDLGRYGEALTSDFRVAIG